MVSPETQPESRSNRRLSAAHQRNHLNLRSIPHFEWDLGIHKSVGLDPAAAALVFVRSPSHFRVSYTPIAARIFLADTPGPTCVNMRRIPFTNVTRPFYPLDLVND